MEYFKDKYIWIRTILSSDAQILCDEETAQGWKQTIDKYLKRIDDFKNGKCIALIAEFDGSVAGYINVYPNSERGAFAHKGYCEIVDLAFWKNSEETVSV